ncbi:MAG: flagellar biosynthetic protein FliR [Bdellovibrionaceae bacterium]|nr:flagellar biosynthetic protein FliR [Pseudobdellovibrionaceae bacterium]
MLQSLYQFPEGQIVAFALVLLRMIAFVVSMPLFGTQNVPVTVKVLLPLVLSFVLFPSLIIGVDNSLPINGMIVAYAFREVFVGLFLGFFCRLFFFAITVAGEIIGISSGLASAQIFNPALGTQTNVLEQFQTLLATLLFLGLNAHHVFFEGLIRSFAVLPIGQLTFNVAAAENLLRLTQQIMILGLQIAAPIVLSVFLANVAMGIIGKAVPQMNVLMTSMQITILITFAVMILTIPLTIAYMGNVLDRMTGELIAILKVI